MCYINIKKGEKMKIKLEEGQTYFNCYNRKEFDVIAIEDGVIRFQYTGSDVSEGDLKQKEDLVRKSLTDKMDGFERNLHALKAVHKEKQEKKKVKFLKNQEEKTLILTQYLKTDVDFSEKYYRTLGFLARSVKIIARIPANTKEWFDERYCMVKGDYPEKQAGYILHTEETNKWYSQVQVLFRLPSGKTSADITFEPGKMLVKGSSYDELKSYSINHPPSYSKTSKFIVNGNELCWWLLELGFNLGDVHNVEKIRSHVPSEYVKCFDEGI